MNRKTKKQWKVAAVLLFFLAAGLWYFVRSDGSVKKQENSTGLTGVLQTAAELTVTPQADQKVLEDDPNPTKELVVYVCGAVKEPGIYTLAEGSRLYEAVTLAGGFSGEADPSYHNLARSITDGERIYILSVAETKILTTEQQVVGEEGANNGTLGGNAPINLNTASAEQLMGLPGIGEARAADILEYRAQIGQFADIEEIMNVSGIGEAMFEKIKDKITVK